MKNLNKSIDRMKNLAESWIGERVRDNRISRMIFHNHTERGLLILNRYSFHQRRMAEEVSN